MMTNSTFLLLSGIVDRAYSGYDSGRTKSLAFRKIQLESFLKMIRENYEDIRKAVMKDLNKSKWEVSIYDLDMVANVCQNFIKNLNEHAKPDKLPFNLIGVTNEAYVSKIPYGVVLIMGTWNLPLSISLYPFLGAVAAGNAVILKPSEVAHHTACILTKLIPQYMDTECYQAVYADASETQELLKLKFDYIYFVGSTENGKYVMKAAAEHLTPVTLELGGKSPCYIHESANLEIAAKRIMWCKTINLGQLCVTPDYLICHKNLEDDLVRAAMFAMRDMYGPESSLQQNPHLGRIINERHCLRLKRLLENTKGRVVYGGRVDLEDLWVQPTIVVDVPLDDPLMQEEIFGPILPIVTANYCERVIEIINSKPKPLALYVFSSNDSVTSMICDNCPSGSAAINDCGSQVLWEGLPFGGIGESGMGYNGQGQVGYDSFCHKRGTLKRRLNSINEKLTEFRYPPYSDFKTGLASLAYRNFGKFNINTKSLATFFLAFILGYIICYFYAI